MNYDIHYLTAYRYDGRSPTTSTRCACGRRRPPTQRCDEFHVRLDPEARVQRHVDYFGTEVLEFGVARPHDHLMIDVRARVVTSEPPRAAGGAAGSSSTSDAYARPPASSCCRCRDEPDDARSTSSSTTVARATRRWPRAQLCELIPDRFAYRAGRDLRRLDRRRPARAGAGVCQDFAHLALVVLRRNGIAARYVSGYLFSPAAPTTTAADSVEVADPRLGRGAAARRAVAASPVWVGADPTNRRSSARPT